MIGTFFSSARSSEAQPFENEIKVLLVPNATNNSKVWVGYDFSRNPVAYFETKFDSFPAFTLSRTIQLERIDAKEEADGKTIKTIKLICLDPKLEKVFHTFLDDVFTNVAPSEDFGDRILLATSQWRELLQVAKSDFSESFAKGLFGELAFLEKSIDQIGAKAIEYWQKSANDVHDFISSSQRVEVKTSSFQNKMAVSINGLKQLEVPTNSELTLAVVEVQKHGSGLTLNNIVENIFALITDRSEFTQKLLDYGFVLGMPAGDEFSFEIITWRFWEITDDSSVLSTSSITEQTKLAISNVNYRLDLGSLNEPADDFKWREENQAGK